MTLKKITMNLTPRDVENADTLTRRLHCRNKASTVSAALAITEDITRRIQDGGQLMIKEKDGSVETLIITGL